MYNKTRRVDSILEKINNLRPLNHEVVTQKTQGTDIFLFLYKYLTLNIMAGTYSQIYLQIIFGVRNRENVLDIRWRSRVFEYMSSIIQNKKQKSIIVNGVSDHVHILIGYKPCISLPDLVREIKNNSSKFMNQENLVSSKFNWQEGYGVFSYSQSQLDNVFNYIKNQEVHHRKTTFREEYIDFLSKYQVTFDEKYILDIE